MYTEHFTEIAQGSADYAPPAMHASSPEVITSATSSNISSGTRVQVTAGPLAGMSGVAAIARSSNRWLVKVLQAGCYVELDASLLERVA